MNTNTQMHFRPFGNDTFKTSEVGLGTWQLGGSWGDVSDVDAQAVLETALAAGVNFYDTADVYGGGRSEQRIAPLLRQHHDSILVATKLGRRGDPGWPGNFTYQNMLKHTEESLRNLQTDTLDLTQLHCVPTEVLREGAVFDHLRTLQHAGKIRRFGASVESMEQANICLAQPGLASLQIIFNIFRQKPIDTLFAAAKQKGVAIIVRLPLASGLLSGKFNKQSSFAADDHRNFNRDGQSFNVGETFAGLPFEKGIGLTEELKALLHDNMTTSMSMSRIALRWILDFDAVSVVIPGATSVAQAKENALASALPPLSKELHAKLSEFYRTRVHANIRGAY